MSDEPTVDGGGALVRQGQTAVALAEDAGIRLRLMGGIAVALHSPSAGHRSLKRDYADIDFVSSSGDGGLLDQIFGEIGYGPDKRFNSLNGTTRRLYFNSDNSKQIDVFVRTFKMCHGSRSATGSRSTRRRFHWRSYFCRRLRSWS